MPPSIPFADAVSSPSPWIVRFASLIRPSGRVLDLACGGGRHARFLAARGMAVLAVDRDAAALEGLRDIPGITTACVDLEQGRWPLPAERFAGIVVTNYLHRPLLPELVAALAPDGVILYETFAIGQERHGRPSRPDFLLQPEELLRAFSGPLRVVAFEQGEEMQHERDRVVQRICAVGPARPWPPRLADGPANAGRAEAAHQGD